MLAPPFRSASLLISPRRAKPTTDLLPVYRPIARRSTLAGRSAARGVWGAPAALRPTGDPVPSVPSRGTPGRAFEGGQSPTPHPKTARLRGSSGREWKRGLRRHRKKATTARRDAAMASVTAASRRLRAADVAIDRLLPALSTHSRRPTRGRSAIRGVSTGVTSQGAPSGAVEGSQPPTRRLMKTIPVGNFGTARASTIIWIRPHQCQRALPLSPLPSA